MLSHRDLIFFLQFFPYGPFILHFNQKRRKLWIGFPMMCMTVVTTI